MSARYELTMLIEKVKSYDLQFPKGISIAVTLEFALTLESELSEYFIVPPLVKGSKFQFMGVNCVVV